MVFGYFDFVCVCVYFSLVVGVEGVFLEFLGCFRVYLRLVFLSVGGGLVGFSV